MKINYTDYNSTQQPNSIKARTNLARQEDDFEFYNKDITDE